MRARLGGGIVRPMRGIVWSLGFVVWVPASVAAQTLPAQTPPREIEVTLAAAEQAALAGNARLAAVGARTEGVHQTARAAGAFRWPGVEATAGLMRTDDPVGVFGTKLRQGRFGEADFALPALNDPRAVTDFTTGIGARWTVGDLSHWADLRATNHAARAADARQDRAADAVVLETRLIYLSALAARERVRAVESERAAVAATAARVERRVAEGLATDADRLQAVAALADATARLRLAEADQADARGALGVQLGWQRDSVPVPADELPRLVDRTDDLDQSPMRADLAASAADVEAARERASARAAARLPSLEVFGQLATHAPAMFDDPSADWTLGLQLRIPLFTGFGLEAGQSVAQAEARALDAEHGDRLLRAEAEVASARRAVVAYRESRDAQRAARDAALEAARLLELRYDEGMATLAELLQVQARAAGLDARWVDAQARWLMGLAQLDFALGPDPRAAPIHDSDSPEGEIR